MAGEERVLVLEVLELEALVAHTQMVTEVPVLEVQQEVVPPILVVAVVAGLTVPLFQILEVAAVPA